MPRDVVHFWIIGTDVRRERMCALRGLLGDREHEWKEEAVCTHVFVPAGDPVVEEIETFLREDLSLPHWKGTAERHWSASERESASWHLVEWRLQQKGRAGLCYENRFDLSRACRVCLLGARYEECMRTDLTPNPRRALHQLLTNEWVINERTRHAFLAEGLHGAQYLPAVNDRDGRLIRDVYLLQPLGVAPPAHPSSPLEQDPLCRECRLDGWGAFPNTQLRFVYGQLLPDDTDFLWTREAIGGRGTSPSLLAYYKVGSRELLVSKRAYRVLRRLGVRGAVFTPVEFKVEPDVIRASRGT